MSTFNNKITTSPPMSRKNAGSSNINDSPVINKNNTAPSPNNASRTQNTPTASPKSSETKSLGRTLSEREVRVVNPLQDITGMRTYLVHVGEKKYKLDTETRSIKKLKAQIQQKYNLQYDFDLEYFDEEIGDWVSLSNLKEIPSNKVTKLRIEQLQNVPSNISRETIKDETGNELILCRENRTERLMKLALHPVNYSRMRKQASNQYCPVVSFLGPTGGGKSSLICKFSPEKKPVTALESQPIPTTSNINSFLATGFSHTIDQAEYGSLQMSGQHGIEQSLIRMGHNTAQLDVPFIRFLDVEGEDGGLPLMEYCKSEGIALEEDLALMSPKDIVEFVKSVFEKCDVHELNRYMEARKKVTKKDFTRLSYIMSDVIVYVNTVPAKRESEYLERVLEFTEAAQRGIASAERPSLIMIFNQCNKREAPFDIDEATDQFFLLVDREKRLLESFRSVDFVKLPDWEYADLYKKQFAAFEDRLHRRIGEQYVAKTLQGTLFSEFLWFNILEKVVENFDIPGQNLSMSKIYAKFIISESSLVNRAYSFFDIIYGHKNDKNIFLRSREIAIKTLAIYLVELSTTRGYESILENFDTINQLFQELYDRIRMRTPCEAVLREHRCTQEYGVHDAHRFLLSIYDKAYEELLGAHRFDDPDSIDKLKGHLFTIISTLKKAPPLEFHKARLAVFADGLSLGTVSISSIPKQKCFICMRNKPHTLLSCRHSFCRSCIAGIYLVSDNERNTNTPRKSSSAPATPQKMKHETLKDQRVLSMSNIAPSKVQLTHSYSDKVLMCPLCKGEASEVESRHHLPGIAGARVLSLDGGGFRGFLQVKILQSLVKFSKFELEELFDVVCGTGIGGVLALAIINGMPLAECGQFLVDLPKKLKKKPLLQKVIGTRLFKFIFGGKYDATELEYGLQDLFSDSDLMTSVLKNENPKAFVVTANNDDLAQADETDSGPNIGMLLLSNYSAGSRTVTVQEVDCFIKLWEAARATVATPAVFQPWDGNGKNLIDGSIFGANPSVLAADEAYNIFGYSRNIDYLVSVGTGLQTSKKIKHENFITYMNDVVDLAETALQVDREMAEYSNLFDYFRLNPDIPKHNLKNSVHHKVIKSFLSQVDAWINNNEGLLRITAQHIRAKFFTVDLVSYNFPAGYNQDFIIIPRKQINLAARGLIPDFIVQVIDCSNLESHSRENDNANFANNLTKSTVVRVPSTVTYVESAGHWIVNYKIPHAGIFCVKIYALFSKEDAIKKLEISGSGFYVYVSPTQTPVPEHEQEQIPAHNFLSFVDWIKFIPISGTGHFVDDMKATEHKQALFERLVKLGLLSDTSTDILSSMRDGDCQVRALAEQLFNGHAEKHPLVRRHISGWLINHPNFRLADGTILSTLVSCWDDYCDIIAKPGNWCDYLTLLAASEFYGVKILIVSSIEGTRYITCIRPAKLSRTKPLLIGQWADFGYSSIESWNNSSIQLMQRKQSKNKIRASSLTFSARPHSPTIATSTGTVKLEKREAKVRPSIRSRSLLSQASMSSMSSLSNAEEPSVPPEELVFGNPELLTSVESEVIFSERCPPKKSGLHTPDAAGDQPHFVHSQFFLKQQSQQKQQKRASKQLAATPITPSNTPATPHTTESSTPPRSKPSSGNFGLPPMGPTDEFLSLQQKLKAFESQHRKNEEPQPISRVKSTDDTETEDFSDTESQLTDSDFGFRSGLKQSPSKENLARGTPQKEPPSPTPVSPSPGVSVLPDENTAEDTSSLSHSASSYSIDRRESDASFQSQGETPSKKSSKKTEKKEKKIKKSTEKKESTRANSSKLFSFGSNKNTPQKEPEPAESPKPKEAAKPGFMKRTLNATKSMTQISGLFKGSPKNSTPDNASSKSRGQTSSNSPANPSTPTTSESKSLRTSFSSVGGNSNNNN